MPPRFRKKVDASQKNIVSEMRKLGIQVIITNAGNDFPDLLCGWANQWVLLEIKEQDGRLDCGQLRFLADANGAVAVVIGADNAIQAVTDPFEYCLSSSQKDKIVKWLLKNPTQESIRMSPFFDLIAEF